ncbi:FkbM family methyltransferase [Altererythrobacter lutimaris]|uniref:FkbM family methyltransferase n=1 Tax=Altererythrobacter lutimaris TaxID=2743979 RepID=A0A850H7E9_9SPHN|nr:FkbM family methyltransferase [Altererythrobacter lutimaris]NVE93689.1 FkbM family methyltransferase [Altererythrobacter lutimaris]
MVKTLLKNVYKTIEPQSVWRWRMHAAFREEVEGGGDPELTWLDRIVPAGGIALDIGANRGVYSYKLAEICSRVIAFEPNPRIAGALKALKRENVEVREIALSNAPGEAQLTIPASEHDHGFATMRSDAFQQVEHDTITIPTARLDDLELPKVDFVKIDVEGFEEQVLEGAMAKLAGDKPAIFIEIEQRHCNGVFERLPQSLAAIGYAGYFLQDDAWHSMEKFDVHTHQLAAIDESGRIRAGTTVYVNNFLFLADGQQPPVR